MFKPYRIRRLITLCSRALKSARAPPKRYPARFLPTRAIPASSNSASISIPVIGPRITALGDTDFISAQINPALQINPRSGQIRKKATIRTIPNDASTEPAIGTRRLCKKLPRIISTEAHSPPATAAFSHISSITGVFGGGFEPGGKSLTCFALLSVASYILSAASTAVTEEISNTASGWMFHFPVTLSVRLFLTVSTRVPLYD